MKKQKFYSDKDLVILAQHGDKEAYNMLLSRYDNRIQRLINSYVQDRAHASDLTQEVLIKIYCYLHGFKEKSHFSTWLYRITQNTIKNHYRKATLRRGLEAEYADNYFQSAQLSPDCLLMKVECGEQLELAMSMLPEELRVCYGMRIFDEYSYEDIAKKMGCPIGTVRSRIFRSRKLLMESIDRTI